jgi:hypothetical protein
VSGGVWGYIFYEKYSLRSCSRLHATASRKAIEPNIGLEFEPSRTLTLSVVTLALCICGLTYLSVWSRDQNSPNGSAVNIPSVPSGYNSPGIMFGVKSRPI